MDADQLFELNEIGKAEIHLRSLDRELSSLREREQRWWSRAPNSLSAYEIDSYIKQMKDMAVSNIYTEISEMSAYLESVRSCKSLVEAKARAAEVYDGLTDYLVDLSGYFESMEDQGSKLHGLRSRHNVEEMQRQHTQYRQGYDLAVFRSQELTLQLQV
jgi:hypothetical protein